MASSPFCDYHWVQGSPLPKEAWNPSRVPLESSSFYPVLGLVAHAIEIAHRAFKDLPHFVDSFLRRCLAGYCAERGFDPEIEVDGGENMKTAALASAAGATAIVAGSAIFGAKDYKAAIADIRQAASAAVES